MRPQIPTHSSGSGSGFIQWRHFSRFLAAMITQMQSDKADCQRMWSKLCADHTYDPQTMLNVLTFNTSIIIFKHKGREVFRSRSIDPRFSDIHAQKHTSGFFLPPDSGLMFHERVPVALRLL